MAEILPIVSSLAALASIAYALFLRMRLQSARAQGADLDLRITAAQKHAKHFEQRSQQQAEHADRVQKQLLSLEKQCAELTIRLQDKLRESDRFHAERQDQQERHERQKEHFQEQIQVLSEQLAVAVKERLAALQELERGRKENDEKQAKQLEILRAQHGEQQQLIQQQKRELSQLESNLRKARAEQVSPIELKRYQAKVQRLEQLYTSMKGLRELAEERNRNWETALRYLAQHTLDGGRTPDDSPRLIGPLVGAALEKIGVRLIDETPAEAAQAEAEAHTGRPVTLLGSATENQAMASPP